MIDTPVCFGSKCKQTAINHTGIHVFACRHVSFKHWTVLHYKHRSCLGIKSKGSVSWTDSHLTQFARVTLVETTLRYSISGKSTHKNHQLVGFQSILTVKPPNNNLSKHGVPQLWPWPLVITGYFFLKKNILFWWGFLSTYNWYNVTGPVTAHISTSTRKNTKLRGDPPRRALNRLWSSQQECYILQGPLRYTSYKY